MKKIALLLAIVLLVAMPLTAQAATPRTITVSPALSYTGTTANCSVLVVAENMSHEIEVTIKLWHGTTCLETWYTSGNGYLSWRDTATVTLNNTYELTIDAVINGNAKDRITVSRKCE